MGDIILHPHHPDYCKECIFNDQNNGTCGNKEYNSHSYMVNCVWKYCPYRKVQSGEAETVVIKT